MFIRVIVFSHIALVGIKIILKMSWDVNPPFIFSEIAVLYWIQYNTVFVLKLLFSWMFGGALCLFAIEGCPIVSYHLLKGESREMSFYLGSESNLNNEENLLSRTSQKARGRWFQVWLNQQCNNIRGRNSFWSFSCHPQVSAPSLIVARWLQLLWTSQQHG